MRKKVEDEEPLDEWERREDEAIAAMMSKRGRAARSGQDRTIVIEAGTVVLIDGAPVTWVKGG